MNSIKRITLIGNAGAGKSFLAQQLHTLLNLPVYHLDQYYFLPGWVKRTPEEYRKIYNRLIDQNVWIIEGINVSIFEERIKKADIVIFLDMPRRICLWRILKRALTYYGKETPTSAKDCHQRFN